MLSHHHIVFHERTLLGSSLDHALPRRSSATPSWVLPPRRHLEPVSPDAVEFCSRVLDAAKLDVRCYRMEPLGRRVAACLRMLRCQAPTEAWAAIQRQPALLDGVVDSLLIGVTWFYRDTAILDDVCNHIRRQPRRKSMPWRIWSVGCSDGAELYTMAMVLAECGALEGSELWGTDCRRSAIERAQAAAYGDDRIGHLPSGWARRYLCSGRGGWTVAPSLREVTRWRVADVMSDEVSPQRWDMILCRNLAIYLKPDVADRMWERLVAGLKVGGLLVLGKAERPQRCLPLKRLGLGLYLKLGANEEGA